ncbi:unnamed protein product, partial [Cyprideis torosa]
VLEDIANTTGPDKYIFLLGCAGWAPGQLEKELKEGGWLTVPGDDALVFDTPDEEKWRMAGLRIGVDISLFVDEAGQA